MIDNRPHAPEFCSIVGRDVNVKLLTNFLQEGNGIYRVNSEIRGAGVYSIWVTYTKVLLQERLKALFCCCHYYVVLVVTVNRGDRYTARESKFRI